MVELRSSGLLLPWFVSLWLHSAGVGSLCEATWQYSLSNHRTLLINFFSPWVLGPELVPVRYRHIGGALNVLSNWTFVFVTGR